jgi:hypothetical protein
MTWLYLLSGLAAALAFYLSTAHQRMWPALRVRARGLRLAGWLLCAVSLATAMLALGPWAGGFAALTMLMLGMVALPYADAWWQARRARDVG